MLFKPSQFSLPGLEFDLTKECVEFIVPTKHLSEQPAYSIAASSLKLNEDFEVKKDEELEKRSLTKVTELLKGFFDSRSCLNYHAKVLKCIGTIYAKCDRLLARNAFAVAPTAPRSLIRNEVTLRYTIGDPLMEMLCELKGLKVIHYPLLSPCPRSEASLVVCTTFVVITRFSLCTPPSEWYVCVFFTGHAGGISC